MISAENQIQVLVGIYLCAVAINVLNAEFASTAAQALIRSSNLVNQPDSPDRSTGD